MVEVRRGGTGGRSGWAGGLEDWRGEGRGSFC